MIGVDTSSVLRDEFDPLKMMGEERTKQMDDQVDHILEAVKEKIFPFFKI